MNRPGCTGTRAGCENKRLHNLVRGQLCTKLYLVLQEGLRLKTSKNKPHVWQVRTSHASAVGVVRALSVRVQCVFLGVGTVQ